MAAEKYAQGFVREVNGKDAKGHKIRKGWQLVVKYKEENPKFREKPEGEDSRTADEKRREVWRQKAKACHARTKAAASKELADWLEELNGTRGEKGEDSPLTVSQVVAEFLKEHETNIEGSTLKSYRASSKYIAEGIGDTPVADLTPKQVRAWLADLGKKYSASTTGKAYRLLKQTLKQLVIDEVIEKNVCDAVRSPKRPSGNPYSLDGASVEKLVGLLSVMEPAPMVTAAYASLYTGLRRGEVCGLRWGDIDMRNRLMTVRRAIGEAAGGDYEKAPKNDGSARTIVVPAGLITVFEKRLARMRADLLAAGIETEPEEITSLYVIGSIDGSYKSPNKLGKEWAAFAENHGLKSIDPVTGNSRTCRFHDLRHTFATLAANKETGQVGIKSVAESMGHSDASMTLNTYAAVDREDQIRLAEKMDSLLDYSEKPPVLKPEFSKTGTEG